MAVAQFRNANRATGSGTPTAEPLVVVVVATDNFVKSGLDVGRKSIKLLTIITVGVSI